MADIRINALATTAASTASDDFVAVDGSANGTRKLNAFSPTFGGNLTVSGGTITGGTSGMSLAAGGTNQNITLTPSGTGVINSAFGSNLKLRTSLGTTNVGTARIGAWYSGYVSDADFAAIEMAAAGTSGGDIRFFTIQSGSTLSQKAMLAENGNFLIGTTTDSSNGKLQLATHTTSAGGIGFGTDTSLYRSAAYTLKLDGGNNVTSFRVLGSGSCEAIVAVSGSSSTLFGSATAGASTVLCSGNATTALTLDSSQNATFAGKVTVSGTDGLLVNKSASLSVITMGEGIAGSYSRFNMRTGSAKYAWSIGAQDLVDNALTITPSTAVGGTTFTTPVLTVAQSGAVTVSGAIAIGNTVQTAVGVASTHKVTISIGGSTYYLLATNV